MTKATINIQDNFLFQALKTEETMRLELMTGTRIEGRLKRFDRFALVLESDDQEVLVYKHAVASITAASE